MRRPVALGVVALFAALLVATVAAPAAVAQETPSAANSTDTTAAESADYTLSELNQGGQKPANANPSERALGTFGSVVIENKPIMPPTWGFLQKGATVRRNEIRLRSHRGYGLESKAFIIRIAHWERGERTVTTANGGTRSEPVASNVTTYSQTVTLPGGYSKPIRIDLRPHNDGAVWTTMCIQEAGEPNCLSDPSENRWLFKHQTAVAASPIDIDSEGDRLLWSIFFMGIPMTVFSASTLFAGSKAIKKARGKPDISILVWVIGGLFSLVLGIIFFRTVTRVFIRAPWGVGAVIGIVLGLLALRWYSRETHYEYFLRLRRKDYQPTDVRDSDDELEVESHETQATNGQATATDGGEMQSSRVDVHDIQGSLLADLIPVRMVERDGILSTVRPGFFKFLARFRGARADLEADRSPRTAIPIDEGAGKRLWILDADSEEPMRYKPEGHTVEWPDLLWRDEEGRLNANLKAILGGPVVLGLGALGGMVFLASWALGALIAAVVVFIGVVLTPDPGRFEVDLAGVHMKNPLATILQIADAETSIKSFEDAFDGFVDEKVGRATDRKRLQDRQSETQMQTLADHYTGDASTSSDAVSQPQSARESGGGTDE